MNKPSSYNHNTLGSLIKPLISNLDFKRVHESLLKGEVEMYERFIKIFSFESFQKQILEDEYLKIKKQNEFRRKN